MCPVSNQECKETCSKEPCTPCSVRRCYVPPMSPELDGICTLHFVARVAKLRCVVRRLIGFVTGIWFREVHSSASRQQPCVWQVWQDLHAKQSIHADMPRRGHIEKVAVDEAAKRLLIRDEDRADGRRSSRSHLPLQSQLLQQSAKPMNMYYLTLIAYG
jgi:hypothetical protein